mmetsp:Transcript_18266/g.52127  ORF Transcript_18266/g.52127 Transcript_18266/m.52127 type:complete len:88 (+) Transcript_18266:799-1062(+)
MVRSCAFLGCNGSATADPFGHLVWHCTCVAGMTLRTELHFTNVLLQFFVTEKGKSQKYHLSQYASSLAKHGKALHRNTRACCGQEGH